MEAVDDRTEFTEYRSFGSVLFGSVGYRNTEPNLLDVFWPNFWILLTTDFKPLPKNCHKNAIKLKKIIKQGETLIFIYYKIRFGNIRFSSVRLPKLRYSVFRYFTRFGQPLLTHFNTSKHVKVEKKMLHRDRT